MYRYPLEIHYVTTEDGFILKIYRIPAGKNMIKETVEDPSRRVVLFQHGLFDSSDSWVCNHENKSFPFALANQGYDVWLGNNRGNKYSRNHVKFNPNKDSAFWNHTFHEMGKYDLPAMIDYILGKTGRDKISYVAHSQGSAQLFSALTYNTDYFTKRLNSFTAFGPVTTLNNVGSILLKILAESRIDLLLDKIGILELLDNPSAVTKLQTIICTHFGILCKDLLSLICDLDPKYDDMDRFIVLISHFPSGTSIKNIRHFSQLIRKKKFAPYDSDTPYDLTRLKDIPIALFVGNQDLLATVQDNRSLKENLSNNNVIQFYKEYEGMGHASFFLSEKMPHYHDFFDKQIRTLNYELIYLSN
jgi:pimeloyl-ACP methyl ester carboxylesterase